MLGPSLLASVWPGAFPFLFPASIILQLGLASVLFLGAAMAITAFPLLACILRETGAVIRGWVRW